MAKNYEQWVEAAKKLDNHLGFDEWKDTDEDSYFDYNLVGHIFAKYGNVLSGLQVKRVRKTLSKLRAAKDARCIVR